MSQSMDLDLFLYREADGKHRLYLSSCSTVNGLRVLDSAAPILITELGATYYLDKPWVNEKDIPSLYTVGQVVEFLDSEPFTDIIDFTATIAGVNTLSSHDDMECAYTVSSSGEVNSILEAHLPESLRQAVSKVLFENPDKYIQLHADGSFSVFATFDNYLGRQS